MLTISNSLPQSATKRQVPNSARPTLNPPSRRPIAISIWQVKKKPVEPASDLNLDDVDEPTVAGMDDGSDDALALDNDDSIDVNKDSILLSEAELGGMQGRPPSTIIGKADLDLDADLDLSPLDKGAGPVSDVKLVPESDLLPVDDDDLASICPAPRPAASKVSTSSKSTSKPSRAASFRPKMSQRPSRRRSHPQRKNPQASAISAWPRSIAARPSALPMSTRQQRGSGASPVSPPSNSMTMTIRFSARAAAATSRSPAKAAASISSRLRIAASHSTKCLSISAARPRSVRHSISARRQNYRVLAGSRSWGSAAPARKSAKTSNSRRSAKTMAMTKKTARKSSPWMNFQKNRPGTPLASGFGEGGIITEDFGMGGLTPGAAPSASPLPLKCRSPFGMSWASPVACCCLALCGMMTFDLLRNMWSWDGVSTINSSLLEVLNPFLGRSNQRDWP